MRQSNRKGRLAAIVLGTILVLGVPSLAARAHASETLLSTGIMLAGNTGPFSCTCAISNLGTKEVTITSTTLFSGSAGQTITPMFDNCSSAPLAPGAACSFGGNSGVITGGTAVVTKGKAKLLRGNCRVLDGSGIARQILPMR